MREVRKLPFAVAALLACNVACGSGAESPDSEPVAEAESRWGFLSDASLVADAPQYLVNKARGAKYRVCLPRYMSAAFPGIESEVFAAINVWGAYLGRAIPVEIETKDLPRARADQRVEDVASTYHSACGPNFDVVMGLAKIEGTAVGLTGASYRYVEQPNGTRRITSFSRYLFLRDYDLVAPTGGSGVAERWTSLAAHEGASVTGPQLLASMLSRTKTRYASASTYLVLPVLTHEYGHVWGLCDQYEGSANCDPRNSSTHRVEASIMGVRAGTQRLFLTDDDIEGVRTLGSKPGFAHDWGMPRTDAPAPIPQRPVELARIESVRRTGPTLAIQYGVVTSGAARYAFSLQGAGETDFTPLTSDFRSTEAVDVPSGRLNVTLSNGSAASPYRVRMVVTPASGEPTTVETSEP